MKAGELIVAKEDGAFKAKYDVVEKTDRTKPEVKLLGANEKYDVTTDNTGAVVADLNLSSLANYTKTSNTFAKVIVDEYGEVRQIIAYNLAEKIVVKDVEKDVIKGYGRREISNTNAYTIIKNGKEISVSDLKEKDLLIYNAKDEVAVVVTDVREGKLDTVYKDGFKFEGKTYDYVIDADRSATEKVKYISDENLEDVDDNVLEEMQKNGEVKVYFSFDKKPLFIDGEAEEVASNYVMLESDSTEFNNRGTSYRTFDVLNSEGKVVKHEIKSDDINSLTKKIFENKTLTQWVAAFGDASTNNNVITKVSGKVTYAPIAKITTDADNKLTKVEPMSVRGTIGSGGTVTEISVDNTYLDGARLQSNTVIFMQDSEESVKDFSVIKWADAAKEFKKITSGDYYVDSEGKVVAIYAKTTDGDTETKQVVGVLKKSKETTGKSRYDVIVEIDGKETSYEAKNSVSNISDLEDFVNEVVVLTVTREGNELKGYSIPTARVVKVKSATTGTLVDTNGVEYIIEGQYYNQSLKSTINNPGEVVDHFVSLYFQPGGTQKYVQVVQKGAVASDNAEVTSGSITSLAGLQALIDQGVVDRNTTINIPVATLPTVTVRDLVVNSGVTLTITENVGQNIVVDNVTGAVTIN